MKHLKWLVGLVALLGFGLFFAMPSTAHAQSINYRSLVYGTNKNSMASPYFIKPASVSVSNHKYVVTMRVKTAKKLHPFPVTMIWVNGEKPQNVRHIKDSAGNSNLYYSFTTTDLSKRVNAKLAVDIPGVYKAKHLITFKFSTAGLPSLSSGTSAKAATGQTAANKSAAAAKSAANSSSKKAAASSSPAKKASQKAASKAFSESASKASSESSQPSDSTKTTSADNKDHSQNHSRLPFLIVGVVVIVAVVLGGGLFAVRKRR